MAINRKYIINLKKHGNMPVIMLPQYNEGYELIFEVLDGAKPAGGLSEYTVKLEGVRSDGLKYEFAGTVSGNTFSFVLDTTMTACAGRGTAEIQIIKSSDNVLFTTFKIIVIVTEAAVPDGSIDADVQRAQEVAAQVQEIVNTATYRSEAWAVGQKNGVDVPSADPTYQNNAKFYAEQAQEIADSIGIDATLSVSGKAADAKKTGDEISSLKGNISQTTRNLVDASKVSGANITVSDGVVSGTAGAFANAFKGANGGIFPWLTFEENTQYTFSFLAKNDTGGATTSGLAFYCKYSDDTTSAISVSNSVTEYTKYKITSTAGKTLLYITASYSSQGSYVWHVKDLQIEKGTSATPYIPHVSATDYVARGDVSNLAEATGDTFDAVNHQLSFMNSRNLYTKVLSKTTSGITFASAGDGYITLNGSNASQVYFDISTLPDLAVESGKEYWLNYSCESATISFVAIYFNYGSGLVLGYDNLVGINKIRIPSGITGMLLRLYAKPNITFSNTKYRLTISEGKSNADLDTKYAEVRFIQAFGTGDSTIIKFSNGKVLVIDFGLDEPQGTLHRNWKRAIADLGFDHIDYGIISHYHGDHIGMLIDADTSATDYVNVPSMIDANTIFFLPNGHPFTEEELDALAWVDTMAGDHNVSNYNAVMTVLNNRGCKIVYPTENEKWNIGGCEVRFWNADHEWIMDKYIAHETYDYNEASLCCYITIGSNRMCFSGDIGLQAMDKFKTSVLACDIFKANHHATGYAIVPKFLNSLMPSLVVTLLGYNLSLGLGNSELQAWCEANNVPNVVTGIVDHNLSLHVDEGGYRWNTTCRRLICADEGIST